jgi:hypothetical protein
MIPEEIKSRIENASKHASHPESAKAFMELGYSYASSEIEALKKEVMRLGEFQWSSTDGKRYLLVDDKVYYSMLIDQFYDGDFEADAVNGGYRVLISKNETGYFVRNAMDEGGNNQYERFAKSKVVLLTPINSPK